MMASFFWKSFLTLARFQLFVLAVLLSSHVKCITISHTPSYMQGDPTVMPGQQRDNKPVSDISRDRKSYSRDQLMAINPSRLTKDLTTRLRSLKIGTGLSRKLYHRKAKSIEINSNHLNWMCFNVQSCRLIATSSQGLLPIQNPDI